MGGKKGIDSFQIVYFYKVETLGAVSLVNLELAKCTQTYTFKAVWVSALCGMFGQSVLAESISRS